MDGNASLLHLDLHNDSVSHVCKEDIGGGSELRTTIVGLRALVIYTIAGHSVLQIAVFVTELLLERSPEVDQAVILQHSGLFRRFKFGALPT